MVERQNTHSNDMSLAEFKQIYFGNLEVDPYFPCIPDSFADLCSGWTQETFR